MVIEHNARVEMWHPQNRFRRQVMPQFVYTSLPWQPGVANMNRDAVGAQNVLMDPAIQAVYPRPLFVPHHQTDEAYGSDPNLPLPVITWTPSASSGAVPTSVLNRPYGFRELNFQQTGSNYNGGLYYMGIWEGQTQGMTFFWSRYDLSDAETNTYPLNQRFQTFRVGVGNGEDRIVYSVRFVQGGETMISRSTFWDTGAALGDEASGWVEVSRLPNGGDVWEASYFVGERDLNPYESGYGVEPGQDYTAPLAPDRYNMIQFTLLAGRMMIRLGAQDHVCYYDEMRIAADESPLWQINYAAIRAQGFSSMRVSGHPMKWFSGADAATGEPDPAFLTEPESIGQRNEVHSIEAEYAGYVPDGCSVGFGTRTQLDGPEVQYEAIFNQPIDGTYKLQYYSDFTCALRAVNVTYPGATQAPQGFIWRPFPERVVIRHSFDPNSLQITSRAQLMFNNNKAVSITLDGVGTIDHIGRYFARTGQKAVEIALARTVESGFMSGFVRQFSGYAKTQLKMTGNAGASLVTVTCQDRRRQLMSPRWNLPWMDGWNMFYAIAYLAQLAGVTTSDMNFFVPPTPFSASFGPDGEVAYFLPVGPGGSVITRRSGQQLWSIISDIAYSAGYMIFFDAGGKLTCRKWSMPSGVKRVFFESDWESQRAGGFAEGAWGVSVDEDMDKVRSDLVIIGVDAFAPQWDPIVYKASDPGVIDDPTAFNHLGYPNPAVWIDSMFAQENYAQSATEVIFADIRNPALSVGLQTWLQPDIFPLDVIAFNSYRHGTTGLRFLVMDVVHDVSQPQASTTVTGTYYVP